MEAKAPAAPPPRVARSGALLLAGTLSANILAYTFFIILSRYLPAGSLGAVGALVNLSTIATVPALGLQLVAARRVARLSVDHSGVDASPAGAASSSASSTEDTACILRTGLEVGAATALVFVCATPLLGRILQVDAVSMVLLAAGLVPMAVTYALQGVLQGSERFGPLALMVAVSGAAKPMAAVVTAATGGSVSTVMLCLALGWTLTAALGLLLTRPGRLGGNPASRDHVRRDVVAASVPTSGLLLLSSLDVLLARHHLTPAESGSYTVGALFEKAALWGMAFLATLFFPAMARPLERATATAKALTITAGLGFTGTALTWAASEGLVRIAGGPDYAGLAPDAWRFTALGSLLALVQVIVYASLARARVRAGVAVWVAGLVAIVSAHVWGDSVRGIVTVMLVTTSALVAVLLFLEFARSRPTVPSARRRARSGQLPH
jgi:O-antigen/teichoic acid export membrane protein